MKLTKKHLGQPCCFSTATNDEQRFLLIEITNHCNLSCPYCHSIPNTGGDIALSADRLEQLVNECAEQSISTLVLSGGEPLLSEQTFILAEKALQKSISTDLCTNGTLIDKKIAARIAQAFKSVTVTLDAVDASIYAKMKNCSSDMFYRCIDGIRFLLESSVNVGVTIVMTSYNADDIENTLQTLMSLGVKKVSLLRLYNLGQTNDFTYELDDARVAHFKDMLLNFSNMKIKLKGWDFVSHDHPTCSAGKTVFGIDHEGYLNPCILLRMKDESCNLNQTTLAQAMQSEYIIQIRNSIETIRCSNCRSSEDCGGGCPAVQYTIDKSFAIDTRCMLLK